MLVEIAFMIVAGGMAGLGISGGNKTLSGLTVPYLKPRELNMKELIFIRHPWVMESIDHW